MARQLASIQRILEINPIDGADSIEKATVLGWHIVIKKDEFKVGDLVIYCEIDSILPEKPEFEFLRPRNFRIRTIRLRKQISQGIIFPLSFLPSDIEIVEDMDVTDILGIIKYEPTMPACLSGSAKGYFPSDIVPKTDETRVQNLQRLLHTHNGTRCYIGEKLDGSSATYYLKDDNFGVCSRNLELKESEENAFWKYVRSVELDERLRSIKGNYAIQGELIGEGIQGNKLRLKGIDVRFFNVFDIDKQKYLNYFDFIKFIEQGIGLKTVPILDDNYILGHNIDEIVNMSIMRSTLCKDVWAEGIVIRSVYDSEIYNDRFSFKAINPEFLLKNGDD